MDDDYPQEDYYETLGVDPEDSDETIRKVYLELAKGLHPDRLKPDATPAARLAFGRKLTKINLAYEFLEDPARRRDYNDRRRQRPPAGGAAQDAPPRLVATPPSLDFGILTSGESHTLRITIHNQGGPTTGQISADLEKSPSPFTWYVQQGEFPILVDISFTGSDRQDVLNSFKVFIGNHLELDVPLIAHVRPVDVPHRPPPSRPILRPPTWFEWFRGQHERVKAGILIYGVSFLGGRVAWLLVSGGNWAKGDESFLALGLGWATIAGLFYLFGAVIAIVTAYTVMRGLRTFSWISRIVALFLGYRVGVWAIHSFESADVNVVGAWLFCIVATTVIELFDNRSRRRSTTP
jgi:hypothetical protein